MRGTVPIRLTDLQSSLNTAIQILKYEELLIGDDVTAVLSPGNYRQFARPYNTRLSRQFGGLSMHCCGRYEQNLAAITQARVAWLPRAWRSIPQSPRLWA